MTTIIIDDERLAREELKNLLKVFPEIDIVGEAKNPEEAIDLINDLKPELIFLDIQMPGMSGFEMLKKLVDIPKVVFVTAYDEFAQKAFDVQALDYIMKPVDPERLKDTMKKLALKDDEFQSSEHAPSLQRSDRLLTIEDKIFIKDGEKCYFVPLSKVRMLESDGNYVKLHFEKKRPMILRSLNSLEERLDPEHFFRANRKYIINLNCISKVENWFNGGLQVELLEDEKIEISRRQAIKFREMFAI